MRMDQSAPGFWNDEMTDMTMTMGGKGEIKNFRSSKGLGKKRKMGR
jgi:hypothetical protein